jgi:SPP1 gp7 family putative phage head morphogenesis protein
MADDPEDDDDVTLLQAITLHQILLEALKKGRQVELVGYLANVQRIVKAALRELDIDTLDELTRRQLNTFIAKLRRDLGGVNKGYVKGLLAFLEEFVYQENRGTTILLNKYTDTDNKKSNDGVVWQQAREEPIPANGQTTDKYIELYISAIVGKIADKISMAYANKDKLTELFKDLFGTAGFNGRDGVFDSIRRAGNSMLNTILQHMSGIVQHANEQARFRIYEWVSVLDDVTSKICRSRNGMRFVYGDGPLPPAHPNCRSRIVPVPDPDQPKYGPVGLGSWLKRIPASISSAVFGKRGAIDLDAVPGINLDRYRALMDGI